MASAGIRLLSITRDDPYHAGLRDAALSAGWEMDRARTVDEAVGILRPGPTWLVVYDWDATNDDWREGVRRLRLATEQPCVLLASPVVDENLREEVVRFHGYDVLARSADRAEIVRQLRFALVWTEHLRKTTASNSAREVRH